MNSARAVEPGTICVWKEKRSVLRRMNAARYGLAGGAYVRFYVVSGDPPPPQFPDGGRVLLSPASDRFGQGDKVWVERRLLRVVDTFVC